MLSLGSDSDGITLHSPTRTSKVSCLRALLLPSRQSPIPLLFCKVTVNPRDSAYTQPLGIFRSLPPSLPSVSCSDNMRTARNLSLASMVTYPVNTFEEGGEAKQAYNELWSHCRAGLLSEQEAGTWLHLTATRTAQGSQT